MLRKNKERFADLVIVGEEQVSLRVLQKRAKRANRKFWGLGASFALISSMVLPYMSYAAAVADSGKCSTATSLLPDIPWAACPFRLMVSISTHGARLAEMQLSAAITAYGRVPAERARTIISMMLRL